MKLIIIVFALVIIDIMIIASIFHPETDSRSLNVLNKDFENITSFVVNSEECEQLKFLVIAREIADANDYVLHEYDCTQFTADLIKTLRKNGYRAYREITTVDCDSGLFDEEICKRFGGVHEVTRLHVYIESVTGEIIPTERYKDYRI